MSATVPTSTQSHDDLEEVLKFLEAKCIYPYMRDLNYIICYEYLIVCVPTSAVQL